MFLKNLSLSFTLCALSALTVLADCPLNLPPLPDMSKMTIEEKGETRKKMTQKLLTCHQVMLKDLVNKDISYGLDLKKVYLRQKILRGYDMLGKIDMPEGVKGEVSSDIENLQNWQNVNLPRAQTLKKKADTKIQGITEEIRNKMKESEKIWNPLKKKRLNQEIREKNEEITNIRNQNTRMDSPLFIETEINRLKSRLIEALGPYGLTMEQLDNLPPVDDQLKSSITPR